MAKRILPTPEHLHMLLIYQAETGKFFWRARDLSFFSSSRIGNAWNAKHSGKEALIVDNNGYKKGRLFGVDAMAHRVAWAMHHGEWPDNHIDHINGIRNDNRISNLRQADRSENLSNRGAQINNSSGFKGVHFCNRSKRWIAKIHKNGITHYLGSYITPEDASVAYASACSVYHGEFARTK